MNLIFSFMHSSYNRINFKIILLSSSIHTSELHLKWICSNIIMHGRKWFMKSQQLSHITHMCKQFQNSKRRKEGWHILTTIMCLFADEIVASNRNNNNQAAFLMIPKVAVFSLMLKHACCCWWSKEHNSSLRITIVH